MSRRMKFQSQAQLNAAYARLVDQSWVDSCLVDVAGLEMHVRVVEGDRPRAHAEAWIATERRHRRQRSPARD